MTTWRVPNRDGIDGSGIGASGTGTSGTGTWGSDEVAVGDRVIEASGLVQEYGGQRAVDGVDLTVAAGSIVGVIGPSGCGKSTLVRMLTGIERPTDGEVCVFGEDPAEASARVRARFGYMPQMPVLFPNLSAWSNLTFIASMYGVPVRGRKRRLLELLDLVDLRAHRRKQVASLSGGMPRRLTLAATLVHDPELLFLDEPTAGVDPVLRERFWEHFRGLRDEGRTIVVPTQYVSEAVSCDSVAVMAHGRMICVQPPDRLAPLAYGGRPYLVKVRSGWLGHESVERLAGAPGVRSVRGSDERTRRCRRRPPRRSPRLPRARENGTRENAWRRGAVRRDFRGRWRRVW